MGIREKLNEHRTLSVALSIVAIIGIWAGFFWFGSREGNNGSVSFITIDDGKTYIRDSSGQVPPFDFKGKVAYRARVFMSDDGKGEFVGYLERMTPEGKRMAAEMAKKSSSEAPLNVMGVMLANTEIKRPGDAQWVRMNDPKANAIRLVMGRDGKPAEPVEP